MALDDQSEILLTNLQRTSGECVVSTKAFRQHTQIDRLRQQGAFKVRFPKFGREDTLEAILINTSGGLTGGDKMHFAFEAGTHTNNVVSTQACEKFYRSAGGVARVENQITLEDHARLIWCPQEAILFRGSQVDRTIDITMHPTASLCLLEPIVFGREAHNERYDRGTFKDRWRIRVGGKIVHTEHVNLKCDTENPLSHPAVLGDNTTIATMLLINCAQSVDEDGLHRMLSQLPMVTAAASRWSVSDVSKTVLRFLAPNSYHLRAALTQVFAQLFENQVLPKVWSI